METASRRYPVGIQTFSEIRKGDYLYIDKTDLVWEMTRMKYVFLSRPRRFGKSLLTTTLDSYFQGQKELFEGLKIMALEKEWKSYPVIHLDLSEAKNQETAESLRNTLFLLMDSLTKEYGTNEKETLPGQILKGLIRRAYERTVCRITAVSCRSSTSR